MEIEDIIRGILYEYVRDGRAIVKEDISNIVRKMVDELYLNMPSVKEEIGKFITAPFPLERKVERRTELEKKIAVIEQKSSMKVQRVIESPGFRNYVLEIVESKPGGHGCLGYVENLQQPELSNLGYFRVSTDMKKIIW